MVEHKKFLTTDDLLDFINDRNHTVNLYPEIINISCDSDDNWHLFYEMRYAVCDDFLYDNENYDEE